MSGLLGRLSAPEPGPRPEPGAAPDPALEGVQSWLLSGHAGLLQEARRDPGARRRLEEAVGGWLVRHGYASSAAGTAERAARLAAELVGLGPLDPLLADPEVSEVMVNAPDEVYVERGGRLERSTARFQGPDHVLQVVQRVIAPLGRRLDYAHPYVDARLPDGSRLHAILPPLAVRGPAVTIRRFGRRRWTAHELRAAGFADAAVMDYLAACVRARANILVSGGTSTGKTTLLNVLAGFIPPQERVLTIEEAAELQLQHPHVVGLEARPRAPDGSGEVTLRDLVRNALRMRPDRLVVGEVRGAEALDLLHALNTGHAGSMSTLHANGPADALDRLEQMALLAGEAVPHAVLRAQVAAVVDLVVHLERDPGGRRQVAWVCGVGLRGGRRHLVPVFARRADGAYERRDHPVPRR